MKKERTKMKIGSKVVFIEKVFSPPYTPYYDAYRGHTFEILEIGEGEHVHLKCVSGNVMVQGWPHFDELVQA